MCTSCGVLGIETSCDETAAAVYDGRRGLLAHELYSQVALHARYGGVVPELASRDHLRKLLPLIEKSVEASGGHAPAIDGIAYTAGRGWSGPCWSAPRSRAASPMPGELPCVGVHHMEGHLLAPLLEPDPPAFPFVALLVSGGHTLLAQVEGVGRYELLGSSLDDAAGEAFDKTAKLLGLGYPGGPQLAALAEQGRPDRVPLPAAADRAARPRLQLQRAQDRRRRRRCATTPGELDAQARADAARGFEEAVVDTLVIKCQRALEATGGRTLVVAGGVGANRRLRARMLAMGEHEGVRVVYPRAEFCTDNAAMIALLGELRLAAGERDDHAIRARARWPMTELVPPVARPT